MLNYPNYMVNEDGNIYSIFSHKFLKPSKQKNGYLTVELFNSKGSKRLLVHRIVAEAFIPNPNNYPQVNHKDENKLNNCIDNLEWCTAKYNMNYGCGAKTRHLKIAIKNGMKVCVSVLQIDKTGNIINRFNSIKEAERNLGISNSHISECCKGKRKTANGFVWRYERGNDLSEFRY